MRKMQVLFPEPVFRRLRVLAKEQDRPVSELVRRAVDRMLDQLPAEAQRSRRPPSFKAGRVLVDSEEMKTAIYDEDAL